MHVSCLGCVQYVSGNILWECFVEAGGVISSPQAALSKLLTMIRFCSKEVGAIWTLNELTMGMIRASLDKGPKLKLKAAEGRYFIPVLRELLRSCFGLHTEHQRLRFNCLEQLHLVYKEMENWHDDGSSTQRFRKHAMRHLLLYGELNKNSVAKGDYLCWKLVPKHHLFSHQYGYQNPKSEWCYAMESDIGEAAKICKAAVNVQHLHTAFISRYVDTQ